jgi:hypothetical protein
MSVNAVIVVLKDDVHGDDAELLIAAIRQLKGVLDVKPHVTSVDSVTAEVRVRAELVERLLETTKRFSKGEPLTKG